MGRGVFEGWHMLVLLVLLVIVVGVVAGAVLLVARSGSNASTGVPRPPSGRWATDPTGRHQLRYWDGSAWTANVSDNGTPSTDPM